MSHSLKCRACGTELRDLFVDLGSSPLSNAYLTEDQINKPEVFLPLRAYVCSKCFLVQLPEFSSPEEIFTDYAYFSSYSDTWLDHCCRYVNDVVTRFALGPESTVIEIGSNDGCLLQYFKRFSVRVMGVDPAANVADEAQKNGIPTFVRFFGTKAASEIIAWGMKADLLVGNNVLAHVPNLNDFIDGMKVVLKPDGVITMEFPHLLKLMHGNQFDTIYHEHFSYFSFGTVKQIFKNHSLSIFDVEEIPVHGGSLRIYASHKGASHVKTPAVEELLQREQTAGLRDISSYRFFESRARRFRHEMLTFLLTAAKSQKTVVGYGAPAKGNTLLNYCGVRSDLLKYTVDRSPHKQGKFLPGSHIPVCSPDRIREDRPDYIVILPWNLKHEILKQMSYVKEWGCRFVVPIPAIEILL